MEILSYGECIERLKQINPETCSLEKGKMLVSWNKEIQKVTLTVTRRQYNNGTALRLLNKFVTKQSI
jgi:hypothetical protein